MMIDIEVIEKRSNNYLPLLFFLLGSFFFTLKNIFYHLGIIKVKSPIFNLYNREETLFINKNDGMKEQLFNLGKDLSDKSFPLSNINEYDLKQETFEGPLYNKNGSSLYDLKSSSSIEDFNININNEGIQKILNIINHNKLVNNKLDNTHSLIIMDNVEKYNNYILIRPD